VNARMGGVGPFSGQSRSARLPSARRLLTKGEVAVGVDDGFPGVPRTVDELVTALRDLRSRSGMSYRAVHRALVRGRASRGIPERPAYDTVYRAFQLGRVRVDRDLVVEIACVLDSEDTAAERWRHACQSLASRLGSAALVDVSDHLPAEPALFVGRQDELDMVARLVDADARAIAFVGMAGAGKTGLAIRVGHALLRAGRFDRVLAVDLCGFGPERPPADPTAVLLAFLRRLGMPADRAHRLDADGRAAAYRRLLAERRTLVWLDNAASAAQVGTLLPAVAGSLALVTSRHDFPDRPDLRRVEVGLLSHREALDLLRDALGADQVDGDLVTVSALTEVAGCLPLALVVIAARIRATPRWTLADHLERLRHRKDLLRMESAVELALDSSHDALPAGLRRMSRLLALHPGADLTAYAAGALAGVDVSVAIRGLAQLAEANLLQSNGSGRYTCHDLIHLHALNRAQDEDAPAEQQAALDRLCQYYERAAALAMAEFVPNDVSPRPEVGPVDSAVEPFADREMAKAWLDAERHNLVATALHAAQHDRDLHTGRQSGTLARYLELAGQHADAELLHTTALGCPDVDQDQRDHTRNNLAGIYLHLGRFAEVLDLYRARPPHDVEDVRARRRAHNNLAVTLMLLGRCVDALAHYHRSLAVAREIGDRAAEAATLNNLGLAYEHLACYEDAYDCLRESVELAAASGDLAGVAFAEANLSIVCTLTCRIEEAYAHNDKALRIARQFGNRKTIGLALGRLGVFQAGRGDYDDAEANRQKALQIAREVGDPDSERLALRDIASLALLRGHATVAVQVLTQALEVSHQSQLAKGKAEILNHLGDALLAAGAPGEALMRYRQALKTATAVSAPREMAHAQRGIADTSAPDSVDARRSGAEPLHLNRSPCHPPSE
jgi:tetratricopeptide (TPR) repeat protein